MCIKRNKPVSFEACEFFSKLLPIPASSASIERIFSTQGLVWTKLRNKLDPEKAGKLVRINT
jgi:hypothetical protein